MKPTTRPDVSGFIIGPIADSICIIGAPVVALLVAGPVFAIPRSAFKVVLRSTEYDFEQIRQLLLVAFINAHLLLVFFRSHANPLIFSRHPIRFIAVPLAVFLIGGLNTTALGILLLVTVWWDVYHSSLQTFGFGRIYDAKAINDTAVGRNLDYYFNLLVYLGPVLAGAHFIDHLKLSKEAIGFLVIEDSSLSEFFLKRGPDFLADNQHYFSVALLAVGIPFTAFYLCSYYRLHRQGYRVSWQKVWLYSITSVVSIYCWGYGRFVDAFWVMNFFHALQYFAIVCFAEQKNLTQLFRVSQFSGGKYLATLWVCSFCLIYGLWSVFVASGDWSMSLMATTSIMHFWYDGFIWSVKKKQI